MPRPPVPVSPRGARRPQPAPAAAGGGVTSAWGLAPGSVNTHHSTPASASPTTVSSAGNSEVRGLRGALDARDAGEIRMHREAGARIQVLQLPGGLPDELCVAAQVTAHVHVRTQGSEVLRLE